jgi:hypothetical protein
MRKTTRCALALAVLCWSQLAGAADQTPAPRRNSEPIGSIAEKTKGMKKVDGFFPVYWEESEGRLWLEVPRLDVEVLHVTGFATGLGSNDIGIDRGALSGSRIIKFERVGPRLLMVQPNYQYRGTKEPFPRHSGHGVEWLMVLTP